MSTMTGGDADYFTKDSVLLLQERDSEFDKTRNEFEQIILNHIQMTPELQINFQEVFIGNMCKKYSNLTSPLEFYPVYSNECETFLNGIMKRVSLLIPHPLY